jgi:hypothetical protein
VCRTNGASRIADFLHGVKQVAPTSSIMASRSSRG